MYWKKSIRLKKQKHKKTNHTPYNKMVYCRKCGKDESITTMHEHHLYPKAHALINNINPDLLGRVALCYECHKKVHLLLGKVDKFVGGLWVDKARGKEDDSRTT